MGLKFSVERFRVSSPSLSLSRSLYKQCILLNRLHTGETPYHCTYCEKKFMRKEHLKNHVRWGSKTNALSLPASYFLIFYVLILINHTSSYANNSFTTLFQYLKPVTTRCYRTCKIPSYTDKNWFWPYRDVRMSTRKPLTPTFAQKHLGLDHTDRTKVVDLDLQWMYHINNVVH